MACKDTSCADQEKVQRLISSLPLDDEIEESYDILRALADPTRLKILYLLKNGELFACEIIESMDKSQSTISHHLNILRKEKIIIGRKEGKWVHYKLKNPEIIDNLNKIFDI